MLGYTWSVCFVSVVGLSMSGYAAEINPTSAVSSVLESWGHDVVDGNFARSVYENPATEGEAVVILQDAEAAVTVLSGSDGSPVITLLFFESGKQVSLELTNNSIRSLVVKDPVGSHDFIDCGGDGSFDIRVDDKGSMEGLLDRTWGHVKREAGGDLVVVGEDGKNRVILGGEMRDTKSGTGID